MCSGGCWRRTSGQAGDWPLVGIFVRRWSWHGPIVRLWWVIGRRLGADCYWVVRRLTFPAQNVSLRELQ